MAFGAWPPEAKSRQAGAIMPRTQGVFKQLSRSGTGCMELADPVAVGAITHDRHRKIRVAAAPQTRPPSLAAGSSQACRDLTRYVDLSRLFQNVAWPRRLRFRRRARRAIRRLADSRLEATAAVAPSSGSLQGVSAPPELTPRPSGAQRRGSSRRRNEALPPQEEPSLRPCGGVVRRLADCSSSLNLSVDMPPRRALHLAPSAGWRTRNAAHGTF